MIIFSKLYNVFKYITASDIGAATAAQGAKADTAVQSATIDGIEVTKNGTELQFPAYPTTLPDINSLITEVIESNVVTNDTFTRPLMQTSPIGLPLGLLKAYRYIADGTSYMDILRTYDNTVASVFEPNDMLVFESGGTHIKTEFSETGTDITPAEAEYTLHEFAVDLTAIKEMEAV